MVCQDSHTQDASIVEDLEAAFAEESRPCSPPHGWFVGRNTGVCSRTGLVRQILRLLITIRFCREDLELQDVARSTRYTVN